MERNVLLVSLHNTAITNNKNTYDRKMGTEPDYNYQFIVNKEKYSKVIEEFCDELQSLIKNKEEIFDDVLTLLEYFRARNEDIVPKDSLKMKEVQEDSNENNKSYEDDFDIESIRELCLESPEEYKHLSYILANNLSFYDYLEDKEIVDPLTEERSVIIDSNDKEMVVCPETSELKDIIGIDLGNVFGVALHNSIDKEKIEKLEDNEITMNVMLGEVNLKKGEIETLENLLGSNESFNHFVNDCYKNNKKTREAIAEAIVFHLTDYNNSLRKQIYKEKKLKDIDIDEFKRCSEKVAEVKKKIKEKYPDDEIYIEDIEENLSLVLSDEEATNFIEDELRIFKEDVEKLRDLLLVFHLSNNTSIETEIKRELGLTAINNEEIKKFVDLLDLNRPLKASDIKELLLKNYPNKEDTINKYITSKEFDEKFGNYLEKALLDFKRENIDGVRKDFYEKFSRNKEFLDLEGAMVLCLKLNMDGRIIPLDETIEFFDDIKTLTSELCIRGEKMKEFLNSYEEIQTILGKTSIDNYFLDKKEYSWEDFRTFMGILQENFSNENNDETNFVKNLIGLESYMATCFESEASLEIENIKNQIIEKSLESLEKEGLFVKKKDIEDSLKIFIKNSIRDVDEAAEVNRVLNRKNKEIRKFKRLVNLLGIDVEDLSLKQIEEVSTIVENVIEDLEKKRFSNCKKIFGAREIIKNSKTQEQIKTLLGIPKNEKLSENELTSKLMEIFIDFESFNNRKNKEIKKVLFETEEDLNRATASFNEMEQKETREIVERLSDEFKDINVVIAMKNGASPQLKYFLDTKKKDGERQNLLYLCEKAERKVTRCNEFMTKRNFVKGDFFSRLGNIESIKGLSKEEKIEVVNDLFKLQEDIENSKKIAISNIFRIDELIKDDEVVLNLIAIFEKDDSVLSFSKEELISNIIEVLDGDDDKKNIFLSYIYESSFMEEDTSLSKDQKHYGEIIEDAILKQENSVKEKFLKKRQMSMDDLGWLLSEVNNLKESIVREEQVYMDADKKEASNSKAFIRKTNYKKGAYLTISKALSNLDKDNKQEIIENIIEVAKQTSSLRKLEKESPERLFIDPKLVYSVNFLRKKFLENNNIKQEPSSYSQFENIYLNSLNKEMKEGNTGYLLFLKTIESFVKDTGSSNVGSIYRDKDIANNPNVTLKTINENSKVSSLGDVKNRLNKKEKGSSGIDGLREVIREVVGGEDISAIFTSWKSNFKKVEDQKEIIKQNIVEIEESLKKALPFRTDKKLIAIEPFVDKYLEELLRDGTKLDGVRNINEHSDGIFDEFIKCQSFDIKSIEEILNTKLNSDNEVVRSFKEDFLKEVKEVFNKEENLSSDEKLERAISIWNSLLEDVSYRKEATLKFANNPDMKALAISDDLERLQNRIEKAKNVEKEDNHIEDKLTITSKIEGIKGLFDDATPGKNDIYIEEKITNNDGIFTRAASNDEILHISQNFFLTSNIHMEEIKEVLSKNPLFDRFFVDHLDPNTKEWERDFFSADYYLAYDKSDGKHNGEITEVGLVLKDRESGQSFRFSHKVLEDYTQIYIQKGNTAERFIDINAIQSGAKIENGKLVVLDGAEYGKGNDALHKSYGTGDFARRRFWNDETYLKSLESYVARMKDVPENKENSQENTIRQQEVQI